MGTAMTTADRHKAAHRKALRVFGKRAFSMRAGSDVEYPPPTFLIGTSYVRQGEVHFVIKGRGQTWGRAFADAARKVDCKVRNSKIIIGVVETGEKR